MADVVTNLEGLKEKIENLGDNLENQMEELKLREERWKKLDAEAEAVKSSKGNIVKFNVSGQSFATKTDTLLKVKDSLFYKIVLSKKFDLNKEIFIDRSNKMFGVIIDYLRNGKIIFSRYSSEDLEELKNEADFYELVDIVTELEEKLKEPVFINFTFNGAYTSGGNTIGTNKIEDISIRDLNTGICCNTPGWIVFELNYEFDVDKIEIGGYTGNTTNWGPSNGSGASILTSKDNNKWTNVGSIPSNFSNQVVQVSLIKSSAKYIKFQHTSYLGLGYLKVLKSS